MVLDDIEFPDDIVPDDIVLPDCAKAGAPINIAAAAPIKRMRDMNSSRKHWFGIHTRPARRLLQRNP